MQPVRRTDVERTKRFLRDLKQNPPKLHHELDLNKIGNLMNKVGFKGPIPKSGSARGFSHELLQSHPMLVEGQITAHVIHGKEAVTYKVFRERLLPYVQEVLDRLEEARLIQEDDENVSI